MLVQLVRVLYNNRTMKFTDGNWLMREGVQVQHPAQAYDIETTLETLTIYAPTQQVQHRGDTLHGPLLTLRLSSPLPDVIDFREFDVPCPAQWVGFGVRHGGGPNNYPQRSPWIGISRSGRGGDFRTRAVVARRRRVCVWPR
jgi:hypothetical protein